MTCKVNNTFLLARNLQLTKAVNIQQISKQKHFTQLKGTSVVAQSPSCALLFAVPWTVARRASLFMGFSRQEYCSGLPFPSPRDLPDPGIEPRSPALQADTLPLSHLGCRKDTSGKVKKNKKQRRLGKGIVTWYHSLCSI